jgi:DNA-binding NarL/FixJ family response regulator
MLRSITEVGEVVMYKSLADIDDSACSLGSFKFLIVALSDIEDDLDRAHVQRISAAGIKVLLLIDETGIDALSTAIALSVHGFVSGSEVSSHNLEGAFAHMSRGGIAMPRTLVKDLFSRACREAPTLSYPQATRITPREQQVLKLLVDGLSNKQIARKLEISEHGTKRLVANILAKLNCDNRTMAVAKVLRERETAS